MGFIDLEKAFNGVNREPLRQVLRMYDVGGKLYSGIRSMYVSSSDCVRVKGGEIEQCRIDSWVYHVSLAVQCIYGWSDEGGEDGDG